MKNKLVFKFLVSSVLIAFSINQPVHAAEQSLCETFNSKKAGEVIAAGVFSTLGLGSSNNEKTADNLLIAGGVMLLGSVVCNAQAVSEQTKTTQEVEEEYKKKNKKLPSGVIVTEYSSIAKQNGQPANSINKNESFQVVSKVKIVEGTSEKIESVEEKIQIFDSEGVESPLSKPKKLESNNSGEHMVTWDIGALKESKSGTTVTVKSILYVNGKEFKTEKKKITVASSELGVNVALKN